MSVRSRTLRPALAAAGLAMALVLSACSGTDEGDGTTYVVGVPIVQSGPGGFAGIPVGNGIKLAEQEINDSGFLGDDAEVEFEIVDTEGDPAQSIAAFKQFEADEAAGVLCCTLGSEAGALQPVIGDSVVPGVITVSILADLADPPHLFRPFEVPSEQGGLYDQFLDTVLPAEDFDTAVMVVNNDNDAMVQDAAVYAAALERHGVTLLETIDVSIADTSFTGPATQIADEAPDVVVASTIGSSTSGLARALRERGYTEPILSNVGTGTATAFETSAGGLAGTVFPVPFQAGFGDSEQAESFAADYEAEFDAEPDMFAAQGYTAAWLMAEGIRGAGSGDPAQVGEALAEIATQTSVYGEITYTDGQAELADPGVFLVWNDQGQLEEWSAS